MYRSLLLIMFSASSTIIACNGSDEANLKAKEDYPICSDKAIKSSDPEWGWEEDQKLSCRMVSKNDESGDDAQLSQGTKASCSYSEGFCSENGGDCSIYPGDGTRSGLKKVIWDEMYRLNASSLGKKEAICRADLAVAMAMQEAHSFKVNNGNLPYDYLKDNRTDGAQNVSLFNMNIDFIKLSCRTNCGKFQSFSNQQEKMYLNKEINIKEAVMRLNEGFDFFTIDGALHFHRGGRTGWQNPGSSERGFARAQKVVADHLRKNPEDRKSDRRISHSIVQI